MIIKYKSCSILTLGGRCWQTKYIDWPRKIAYVEPTDMRGRSQWLSTGQPMHYEMCQAIAQVLLSRNRVDGLSSRSQALLEELQEEFGWLVDGKSTLLIDDEGNANFWTFSGKLLNAAFSEALADEADKIISDNLCITFTHVYDVENFVKKVRDLMNGESEAISLSLEEDFIQELKFAECLSQIEIDKEIFSRYSLKHDFDRFSSSKLAVVHIGN
jgi:ATP-dependent Lhr-like helicase